MANFPKARRRKMKRRAAVVAAGLMSVATVAGASVLIQNFMAVDFDAGAPPCLIKTMGDDANDPGDATDFEGFDFTLGTTNVDNVALTEEKITINGLTGDRVVAEEVYVIENNCDSPLEVSLVNGVQTDTFADKHLEVWLGTPTAAGYPGPTNATYDPSPLVFDAVVADQNFTTGTVTIPAGSEVPVGMIVSTGAAATGTDGATWTVQAVAP